MDKNLKYKKKYLCVTCSGVPVRLLKGLSELALFFFSESTGETVAAEGAAGDAEILPVEEEAVAAAALHLEEAACKIEEADEPINTEGCFVRLLECEIGT